jgi:hypothetical protein
MRTALVLLCGRLFPARLDDLHVKKALISVRAFCAMMPRHTFQEQPRRSRLSGSQKGML